RGGARRRAHGAISKRRFQEVLSDDAGLTDNGEPGSLPVPALMTPAEAIEQLLAGSGLGREQARGVMDQVMAGEATPVQIAGLLIALRAKGETAEEMAGFVDSMRARATPLPVPAGQTETW